MTRTIAIAIDSQPEGIDVYTNTRNAQKLRGVAFAKATHEACVGCLEDMTAAVKSLENIWACGASIDICQQGQAATIKALVSQLNKVKSYASTIHGLNLILHRFASRTKMEKTALLRESLGSFLVLGWTLESLACSKICCIDTCSWLIRCMMCMVLCLFSCPCKPTIAQSRKPGKYMTHAEIFGKPVHYF